MYKYKNDIYDFCTSTAHRAIELFCNEINNSDAEVFVIMAHKAVLLFQVLLEQNHIIDDMIKNKIIITNHALDFDCSYLKEKRIAIIDDIVISGTSLATVVNKLLSIGIRQRDINIIALATDEHYFSMDFVNADGQNALHCNTVLEDATCIELSYFISKTFAYYGMPYDIEFPIYKAIELNEEKINLLFNNFLWKTDEISNIYQKNNNVDSYTFFPGKSIREMLWKRIGVNLDKCAHLKLRVYTICYPNGKKECRIMPLCLFDGITEEDLNTIFDLFKPMESGLKLNKFIDDRSIPKIRYVQFYIAHQFYLVFNNLTALCDNTKPNRKSIYLLFGLTDGKRVYNSLNNVSQNILANIHMDKKDFINKDLVNEYLEDIGMKLHNDTIKLMEKDEHFKSFLINYVIFSPFLWWYDKKEITVRKDLIQKPKNYIKDFAEIINMTNRLNSGFSLSTLQAILNYVLLDYEVENIISLFIDRSIDEGIIVPTIYHNKKEHYLCRAYRHGEDLPFGIADECRLLFFIKEICRQIPNICYEKTFEKVEGIAQISMEKMIVLFYQMGIKRNNIFNRFLGFDNIELLKTYLSLHGTVKGFIDPQIIKEKNIKEHFYSEKDDNDYEYITWLTKWLLSKGFIIESLNIKKNVYNINLNIVNEFLDKNERNCMSDVIKNEISNIASMISAWYNTMAENKNKNLFKEDITALTSCSDVFVYASAIATEIHYFSKFYYTQVNNIFGKSYNVNELILKFTSFDYERNKTLNIEQALNSGRNKVKWFEEERASKIVSKVSTILKDIGVNTWSELWEDVKSAKYKANYSLKKYIDQAVGFIYFYSACYDCLIFKEFWEFGTSPKNYDSYRTNYERQCQKTELLDKSLFVQLDKVKFLTDFSQKKSELNKLITQALMNSEDSVNNIELEIEKDSFNYTIQYKSCLIFDVRALSSSCVKNIIMDIYNQIEDIDVKTQINIICFPDELSEQEFIRYGFFYNISSKNNKTDPLDCGEVLISIYKKLCKAFDGRAYETKAIMLPNIPPGRMYQHNVQKNIKRYAMKFYGEVIKPLKNCFVRETRQQLILAMTDFVDLEFYDKIKAMEWNDNLNSKSLSDVKSFSNIITYYNSYIPPEYTEKKEVAYSILKILCDGKWGTGFLIRTPSQILCITCNHVLSSNKECEITAISSYKTTTKFTVSPIKKIISYNYDENKNVLDAEDEVAILKPQWDGKIPFDFDSILSLEELKMEISLNSILNCSCCGYFDCNTLEYSWSDNMKAGKRIAKGYYETIIDDNKENSVKGGYSGGIITLYNDSNYIIGIHEGHVRENRGRMISCSTISKVIRKELELLE